MLESLKRRWLTSLCLQADVSGLNEMAPFDLLYLSGACIMLLGGTIVSFVALTFEKLWKRISENPVVMKIIAFVRPPRRNSGHYMITREEEKERWRGTRYRSRHGTMRTT